MVALNTIKRIRYFDRQQLATVFLNQMQTLAVKTTVLQQLVQFLVQLAVYILTKREKLREQMAGTGVEVGRNPDGSVQLIMPGSITFDTNKSNIKPNFYATLDKVAQTLAEDNKSAILVTGYTDNTGNDSINIPLSQARAQSVKNYLAGKGVPSSRIDAQGYGSSNPIADNSTASGREQNRRVEISIYAKQ